MTSEIDGVFYPVSAFGLYIFNVALWSLVTFIISKERIIVSISLDYFFLFIVDMEKVELLPLVVSNAVD